MITVATNALLFDMDGVLIDSTPAVSRVWTKWAIDHGFDPAVVVPRAHGRPSISTVREFLPHADHQAENRLVERSEIEDVEGVVPLPGSLELLASLPDDRWAIVTSSTRALAEVRLLVAGLPRPQVWITSSDIVKGKPDPEPYIKGAGALGVTPADCVVFEDVPAGIRSGKSAGAKVVAFCTTVSESELQTASPDWVLPNCAWVRAEAANGKLTLRLLQTGCKTT